MKQQVILFLIASSISSCTENNQLNSPNSFTITEQPTQLEQNYYVIHNNLPVSILGADDFVSNNSLLKVEKTFQKQIHEFSNKQSLSDAETVKRNVFINHFSKLVLQKYLRFDNDEQKEKCIYYSLSYLKTGPTDLGLNQRVFEFLKKNKVLSKSTEAEIAYTLSKSSEFIVDLHKKEIVDLKTALEANKDAQTEKVLLTLIDLGEKRLQKSISNYEVFKNLPQKPIDLNNRKFIIDEFLTMEIEKYGVGINEIF